MNLTNEQIQLLKQDEEKGIVFKKFLDKINQEYKDYFDKQENGRNHINWFFALLENTRPPAIRLRYVQTSSLDGTIKSKVIDKYKELFGNDADYQVIEK